MARPKFVCPSCSSTSNSFIYRRGSRKLEILLWLLIVPGLFYTLWRESTKLYVCEPCDVVMISVKTPHGQKLIGA